MYEVSANIPSTVSGDRILDELVALFEEHGQDCTCAIVKNSILGYVEEDMLSLVTASLLRHVSSVKVKLAMEGAELEFA